MSGYRHQGKIYKLKFEDYDGLEVVARSMPIGQFLDIARLADLDVKSVKPADIKKLSGLFEAFAKCLISWNLEDEEGDPVPATLEAVLAQETDFTLDIVMTWITTLTSVSSPLEKSSSNGDQSLEQSLKMESL